MEQHIKAGLTFGLSVEFNNTKQHQLWPCLLQKFMLHKVVDKLFHCHSCCAIVAEVHNLSFTSLLKIKITVIKIAMPISLSWQPFSCIGISKDICCNKPSNSNTSANGKPLFHHKLKTWQKRDMVKTRTKWAWFPVKGAILYSASSYLTSSNRSAQSL